MKKLCLALIISILIFASVCALCEDDIYYMNEPATDKLGISVTLLSVSETMGSNSFTRAPAGNIYIICDFLIENNSDVQIWIYAGDSFAARVDGDKYYLDYSVWAMGECEPFFNNSIRPGQKYQGQVGFEVSKDWQYIDIEYYDWPLFDEMLQTAEYTFRYEKYGTNGQTAAESGDTSAEQTSDSGALGMVSVQANTNVRQSASGDSTLVTTIQTAGNYYYYELTSGWYYIKIDDNTFGYVYSSRCQVVK